MKVRQGNLYFWRTPSFNKALAPINAAFQNLLRGSTPIGRRIRSRPRDNSDVGVRIWAATSIHGLLEAAVISTSQSLRIQTNITPFSQHILLKWGAMRSFKTTLHTAREVKARGWNGRGRKGSTWRGAELPRRASVHCTSKRVTHSIMVQKKTHVPEISTWVGAHLRKLGEFKNDGFTGRRTRQKSHVTDGQSTFAS